MEEGFAVKRSHSLNQKTKSAIALFYSRSAPPGIQHLWLSPNIQGKLCLNNHRDLKPADTTVKRILARADGLCLYSRATALDGSAGLKHVASRLLACKVFFK